MEAAIVKAEPVALAGAAGDTARVVAMRQVLSEESEMRGMVKVYVGTHMLDGTDFGKIPGTVRPTLLKPGAEKLLDLFRATPRFALVHREEDFDRGFGFCHYIFRVRLVSRSNPSEVLAEGFGSANSREARYRWRQGGRKCPTCGKEAIIKGKDEFGGGWICFAKKGGCGGKWPDGAQEIEKQETGRIENDDVATLFNTILKMAKKRALVDGAIALARCSDLFTQDVEDLEHPEPAGQAQAQTAPQRRSAPSSPEKAAPATDTKETKELLVNIGRHKGKRLSDVPTEDLPWLLQRATESEARKHEKWHAKDLAWLKAVQAEMAKRSTGGQQPAPANGAAAPKGTPFERLKAGMRSLGVPDKAYLDELKKREKKCPADVTEDDYRALMAFFQGVGQEPPPPGDEDAPPEVGA